MTCWLSQYKFCQWVSLTSRTTGQVKKKSRVASCIQTTTGMLYKSVCRRSSERHQHLWINCTWNVPRKAIRSNKDKHRVLVLATNIEEVLISQNTKNASIWGNCFYGFTHLNLKNGHHSEREMKAAAIDGIGLLRYPLVLWMKANRGNFLSQRQECGIMLTDIHIIFSYSCFHSIK